MAIDRGYRPPNTSQAVGGALGTMGEALMRISSMQSDRVDRAYTLARQNRLDQQAVQRIELDSRRLAQQAEIHEQTKAGFEHDSMVYDENQANAAATAWRKMQKEGIVIRTDEVSGLPMASEKEVQRRINNNEPIGDITMFDAGRSHESLIAGDIRSQTRTEQEEALARGVNPTSGMPLTPEEIASGEGKIWSGELQQGFTNDDEGRGLMSQGLIDQEVAMTSAKERAEEDPYAALPDEAKIGMGYVWYTDPETGVERLMSPQEKWIMDTMGGKP